MRIAAATLAIVAAALAAAAIARADETPMLGRNLAGETCKMDAAPSLIRNANIVCGESNAAAGTVRMASVPQDLATSRERLKALMDGARALRSQDAEQANCDAPQWIGPDNGIALSICTISGNGWPHIVLAASSGIRALRSRWHARAIAGAGWRAVASHRSKQCDGRNRRGHQNHHREIVGRCAGRARQRRGRLQEICRGGTACGRQ